MEGVVNPGEGRRVRKPQALPGPLPLHPWDGCPLPGSHLPAPPILWSSVDPLATQAEGTALLAVTGGSAADYFGEFGLTLLIDQNPSFLI